MKHNCYIYLLIITFFLPGSSFASEEATAIPEPSTILLLGFAIIGLGVFLFWKSKKKKK